MILEALTYPIRKNGWMMILLGAVFSVVLDFFSGALVVGWAVGIFAAGYFGSFYLSIVSTTMGGATELPDWPSFRDMVDDIILPFLSLVGLYLISFGPLLAVLYLMGEKHEWYRPAATLTLLYGIAYFPMSVLASLAFGNIVAALPHVVFPAIGKTLPLYLGILGIVVLSIVILVLVSAVEEVPDIGVFVMAAATLYFMMFLGRLIGKFYVRKTEVIGWE